MVVVEEGILDIPVVEGTLVVAAAVLRGILMAEDKGLSTLVGDRVLGELSGNSFACSGWLQNWRV